MQKRPLIPISAVTSRTRLLYHFFVDSLASPVTYHQTPNYLPFLSILEIQNPSFPPFYVIFEKSFKYDTKFVYFLKHSLLVTYAVFGLKMSFPLPIKLKTTFYRVIIFLKLIAWSTSNMEQRHIFSDMCLTSTIHIARIFS